MSQERRSWIAPELREDRGEIQAAEVGRLHKLDELDDVRGDLEMHFTWSAGRNSVEEMVAACTARGYEYGYLLITGGLDEEKLRQQVVISTDAHRTAELDLMRYGVEQARRAWLTADHVLNTRSLEELEAWLEGRA